MFQLHCLNPISKVGLSQLNENYKMSDDVNAAQGILLRSADMHEMELPNGLLAVARAGAGVNNIPLDKCAEKGIVVFNTPGANANAVKELVLAGMFLAARDIVGGIEWVKENSDKEDVAKLAEKEKKRFAGTELLGKKLGVIGLGAIGGKVANAAVSLGMSVYGYGPYTSVVEAWNTDRTVKYVTDIDEIFENCDYITIHVPALPSTKGMINKEAIAKMKDTAIILNFARDVLCDEDAIIEALDQGKLGKYVSDFANPKTAGHKGCIVIPHLGASTEEAEENCAVMAVQEMMDYLENGNIKNSVNYPPCNMGVCKKASRVAIFHRNVTSMLSQISSIAEAAGVHISQIQNNSKGEFAYMMLDLDQPFSAETLASIEAIDGVCKIRVVK